MTAILTDDDVAARLVYPDLLAALRQAHVDHAGGRIVQPLPGVLAIPGALPDDPERPRHVLMSAATAELTVVKTLLDAPARRSAGEPAQRSVLTAYSTRTGDCLALLDGRTITRMRTAAATVLAVGALARAGLRTVAVVGAGGLAAEHVRALRACLDIDRVGLWARRPEAAQELATGLRGEPDRTVPEVFARTRLDELIAESDAIITVTPATEPLLTAASLRPGLHVSAVGSPPRPGHRELDESALAAADLVVVDDAAIAQHESAQIRAALGARLAPEKLVELGDILAGSHPGRTREEQITVHSSIGVAFQDLAATALVLRATGILPTADASATSAPARTLG